MTSSSESLKSLPDSVQNYVNEIIKSELAKKIVLFGSRARGDHRANSDFDIAVEWIDDDKLTTQILDLKSSLNEKSITLHKIDLLDINTAGKDYLSAIEREGKLLWQKKV